MVRSKGGRANPRAIHLRERAQNKMIRSIEREEIVREPRRRRLPMTPEMRVGYLQARLEDLEREKEELQDRRSMRVRLFLLPGLEDKIRGLRSEIMSILVDLAEGTLSENRTEYEVESIDFGSIKS